MSQLPEDVLHKIWSCYFSLYVLPDLIQVAHFVPFYSCCKSFDYMLDWDIARAIVSWIYVSIYSFDPFYNKTYTWIGKVVIKYNTFPLFIIDHDLFVLELISLFNHVEINDNKDIHICIGLESDWIWKYCIKSCQIDHWKTLELKFETTKNLVLFMDENKRIGKQMLRYDITNNCAWPCYFFSNEIISWF